MARSSLFLKLAMGFILLLNGCGGEPSEADLDKAVKKFAENQLAQTQAKIKRFGNNPMTQDLAKGFEVDLSKVRVKKLACAKAEGNPGYNCDVEVSAAGEGALNPQKSTVKGRFVKSDDGWALIEERG